MQQRKCSTLAINNKAPGFSNPECLGISYGPQQNSNKCCFWAYRKSTRYISGQPKIDARTLFFH